jgi:hypothetical protein
MRSVEAQDVKGNLPISSQKSALAEFKLLPITILPSAVSSYQPQVCNKRSTARFGTMF